MSNAVHGCAVEDIEGIGVYSEGCMTKSWVEGLNMHGKKSFLGLVRARQWNRKCSWSSVPSLQSLQMRILSGVI